MRQEYTPADVGAGFWVIVFLGAIMKFKAELDTTGRFGFAVLTYHFGLVG